MPYPIYTIISYDEIEQLGTKEKFWFYDEDNTKKLFKIGRANTGEDWAEKVAYELAELLDIPCAIYEFAKWYDKKGTISISFISDGARLIHGNELLVDFYDDEYPDSQKYHLKDYKLNVVLDLIESLDDLKLPVNNLGIDIDRPIKLFIGYLIFDCWIANQDRHHENWGFIESFDDTSLAPTYDHAAGFGCKVSAIEAKKRLETKDKNYSVKKFVTKAKSPFYNESGNQLKTIEVIEQLAQRDIDSVCYWIDKIVSISMDKIQSIFDEIPNEFIEENSKKFAQAILYENRLRLLELKKEICDV
jgi:hypothetical protein